MKDRIFFWLLITFAAIVLLGKTWPKFVVVSAAVGYLVVWIIWVAANRFSYRR